MRVDAPPGDVGDGEGVGGRHALARHARGKGYERKVEVGREDLLRVGVGVRVRVEVAVGVGVGLRARLRVRVSEAGRERTSGKYSCRCVFS